MDFNTTPEFFVNMKSVPTPDSSEYDAFVKGELDKLSYGVTINGVYFSNWLYWHLNYWKIYRPALDPRSGEVVDIFEHPQLRDNEWMIAEYLEQARQEKKGLIIVGARRLAKTTFAASYIGLGATIYEGSQNIVVGNNKPDLTNITTQMDKGLSRIEPFMRYGRILDNWANEVSLGWKKRDGTRLEWSRILIRNTEAGKATEILAGITPKTLYYDEIGKAPIKEPFNAAIPAFASPFGWRCVPILTGTGGDFKNGNDAEEMFHYPERFNLLGVEMPGETKKTGIFIPGTMSLDVPKIEQPISQYLHIPTPSELDHINIHVSDFNKGLEMIENKREMARKANDQKEYLKVVMYAPLNIMECFMSDEGINPYPVDAAKKHFDLLRANIEVKYVELYKDTDGSVKTKPTKLRPVTDFPVTKDSIKEGSVVIYEDPMPNAPVGLYIAGSDPYNQNTSANSPSLGTGYIYKRTYDPIGGTFQNRIVASYASRPHLMSEWFKTMELLLEYYNATCMIENEGTNFIQYMETKNKSHYLADGYNIAREINPKISITGRTKGLPATVPVQRHYFNLTLQYCNEEIIMAQKDGENITVPGIVRIPDPLLLQEIINYRPNTAMSGGPFKNGNYDRIVAFGHALAYDEYLQKYIPNVRMPKNEVITPQKREPRSPFNIGNRQSPFASKGNNPFGIK